MLWLIIQISGLLLLIFLVGQNNIKVLAHLLFGLLKHRQGVVRGLSFFFLPGTFIHEIGHFVFAEGMMVRTDDLNVIPQIKEDGTVKLGGVKIEQTDMVRRTIIGFAPVLFGLISIWVGTYYLTATEFRWPYLLFYVYLIFQISHTMFSSKKDLEGAVIGLALIMLIVLGFKYLSEIVVLDAFVTAKNRVLEFLAAGLPYLRTGLLYAFIVDLLFGTGCLLMGRVFQTSSRAR